MPTVEFVTFKASNSFLENPEKAVTNTMKWTAKQAGFISAYYGVALEDKSVGHIVIGEKASKFIFINLPAEVWETFEHHDAVMKREDYKELIEHITPCMEAPLVMQHVSYEMPYAALESPTTEMATFKLKDIDSKEKFNAGMQALCAEIADKCHSSCVWNEVRENLGSYILIVGWESKEYHQGVLKGEMFRKIIGGVRGEADISLVHVNLQKFTQ